MIDLAEWWKLLPANLENMDMPKLISLLSIFSMARSNLIIL
jgi:hypothetical protein